MKEEKDLICKNCKINKQDVKSNDLNLCLDCYNFDLEVLRE